MKTFAPIKYNKRKRANAAGGDPSVPEVSSKTITPSPPQTSREVPNSRTGQTLQSIDLMTEFPDAKILAVDDEFTNLQVLKNQLASEKYQTLTAQNGAEALEIVEREKPHLIFFPVLS